MIAQLHGFREVAPGILQWSRHQLDRGLDFNGLVVLDPAGHVAIDPPPLEEAAVAELQRRGGVAHVVVTNRHHGRWTAELVALTGARVHAHRADAPALAFPVDESFEDGATLPAGLLAISVPDSKSPGETALLLQRDGGTMILGDALIGRPAGQLSLLPDEKFADPRKAADGLRVLLRHEFTRLLVGDGASPTDARLALTTFLASRNVPTTPP